MKNYEIVVSVKSADTLVVKANSREEAIEKVKEAMYYPDEGAIGFKPMDDVKHIGGYTEEAEITVDDNNIYCDICGRLGTNHNAQPYADGRCCDICNKVYVIPARFKAMAESMR